MTTISTPAKRGTTYVCTFTAPGTKRDPIVCEFTEAEYRQIEQSATQAGETMPQFFDRIIVERLWEVTNTPSKELHASLVASNHVAVFRLADQLDRSPYELATEIFAAGVAAIDWSLRDSGRVCFPLHLTCAGSEDRPGFDLTARLNSMAAAEAVELEERAQAGNVPLQSVVRTDGQLPFNPSTNPTTGQL